MNADKHVKRDRGLLSAADREYIFDRESYAEGKHRQSVHQRRSEIQKRIHHGILDLAFLEQHLSDEMKRDIYGEHIYEYRVSMLAFLYDFIRCNTGHSESSLIADAVQQVESDHMPADHTVSVDVDVKARETEFFATEGKRKMQNGEPLSDTEIRAMLESGIVDTSKVASYISE